MRGQERRIAGVDDQDPHGERARGATKPRLLALNQYYRPAVEADGELLAQLCESLGDEYDVTIVTGRTPHAPRPGRLTAGGVSVVRVPSAALPRASHAARAVNYATFAAAALAASLAAPPPDVVLSFTNPPFAPALAAAAARRFGAPLVAVSQDVFPETALAVGELRDGAAARALGALTRLGLARADRVVAVGETMRRRLEAKGVEPAKLRVIPNWTDTEVITPRPRDNAWARAHGLAGRFVVMHSGNVGHAQDLDSLVRAAPLLDDLDEVELAIVGSGSRLAALQQLAREVGAHRVRFLPYQPRSALPESLSAAAVHVVGLARGLAGYVVPSRLLGVLAAERAVIAASEPESELAHAVEAAGCGWVVPPGNPEALAGAIRTAHGEPRLDELGARGRSWVEQNASRPRAVESYRALLREVRCC